jgi:hypothetical protein
MSPTRLDVFPVLTFISTFLKRKGGLFKKAHELSVLCSVDVAVIIFGHNKKLYEFSSGDINETIGRYQYVCHLEVARWSSKAWAEGRNVQPNLVLPYRTCQPYFYPTYVYGLR